MSLAIRAVSPTPRTGKVTGCTVNIDTETGCIDRRKATGQEGCQNTCEHIAAAACRHSRIAACIEVTTPLRSYNGRVCPFEHHAQVVLPCHSHRLLQTLIRVSARTGKTCKLAYVRSYYTSLRQAGEVLFVARKNIERIGIDNHWDSASPDEGKKGFFGIGVLPKSRPHRHRGIFIARRNR